MAGNFPRQASIDSVRRACGEHFTRKDEIESELAAMAGDPHPDTAKRSALIEELMKIRGITA